MADFRALFEMNFFSQAMVLHALLPVDRLLAGRVLAGILLGEQLDLTDWQ